MDLKIGTRENGSKKSKSKVNATSFRPNQKGRIDNADESELFRNNVI